MPRERWTVPWSHRPRGEARTCRWRTGATPRDAVTSRAVASTGSQSDRNRSDSQLSRDDCGRPRLSLCYHRGVRRLAVFVALVLFAGCHSTTGPTVSLNEQFTLAPGASARVQGTGTSITFVGVDGDSRCPADAFCIQGGDARVTIEVVSLGTKRSYELHTGAMKPVTHDALTIALMQLSPYPFSSTTIAPCDYRATFLVTR